jgi:hypothetical protein
VKRTASSWPRELRERVLRVERRDAGELHQLLAVRRAWDAHRPHEHLRARELLVPGGDHQVVAAARRDDVADGEPGLLLDAAHLGDRHHRVHGVDHGEHRPELGVVEAEDEAAGC